MVAALEAAVEELRQAGVTARWVRPEQLHFTLRFLGEIPDGRAAAVSLALAQALEAVERFTLEIAGLGAFPRPQSARVVWAGCGEGADRLAALAGRVESALVGAGFEPETRPFAPHLTLGRLPQAGATPQVAAALRKASGRRFGAVAVSEVVLFRSDLRPQGPLYTPLSRHPLR